MRSAAVLCVLGAGCFAKPGPPAATDGRDASPGDGNVRDTTMLPNDALANLCTIDDDFAVAGPACGTWGTETGTPMRAGGVLVAAPPAGAVSTCTTKPLQPSGAITIELVQLGNMADQNYAVFDLTTQSGNATLNIYRESQDDSVNAQCGGARPGVPYSMTAHRYLRYSLEPAGSDLTVRLLASADGAVFDDMLTSCTLVAGALGPVSLTFGSAIDGSSTLAPISHWDNLHYDCQ